MAKHWSRVIGRKQSIDRSQGESWTDFRSTVKRLRKAPTSEGGGIRSRSKQQKIFTKRLPTVSAAKTPKMVFAKGKERERDKNSYFRHTERKEEVLSLSIGGQ